jgi:hypothetical protein
MNSKILGFDFRHAVGDDLMVKNWSSERRLHYLLKPDIVAPLSIDRSVWPSYFSFEQKHSKNASQMIYFPPSEFHQQVIGLWANLLDMKNLIESRGIRSVPAQYVCFTQEDSLGVETDEMWQVVYEEATVPSNLDGSWKFNGYDIADRFFTSALSNCGFISEEDMLRSRGRWMLNINEQGLFSGLVDADNYRKYSDVRIPEHAPFHIVGIYTSVNNNLNRTSQP